MSRPCQIMQEESVFAGSVVRLIVGEAVCPVAVHLRLLRARSPYFHRLLEDWSQSDDELVLLPAEDPNIFDQLLAWIYTDNFFLQRKHEEWLSLCKLWLLAERYQVSALQNRLIEDISCRLYKMDLATLDLKVLAYVFKETLPGSLLRRLFVHISVCYGNDDGFAELTSELPPEFHTEYALQRAAKERDNLNGGLQVDPWDLTRFIVQEGEVPSANESKRAQHKVQEQQTKRARRDSMSPDNKKTRD